MCYLGQGWKALAYLAALVGPMLIQIAAPSMGQTGPMAADLANVYLAAYTVGGVIHVYWVADRNRGKPVTVWYASWRMIVFGFVILPLAVLFGVDRFLWQFYTTEAASMRPTFEPGDMGVIHRTAYGIGGPVGTRLPRRGDLVVFSRGEGADDLMLKRVIGLPGDTVALVDSVVRLNGRPLSRAGAGTIPTNAHDERWSGTLSVFVETLPDGRAYRVAEATADGPWDTTETVRVPPGHLFVLGDNRDRSRDSRSMQTIGFVPAARLVGRIDGAFWNTRDFRFVRRRAFQPPDR